MLYFTSRLSRKEEDVQTEQKTDPNLWNLVSCLALYAYFYVDLYVLEVVLSTYLTKNLNGIVSILRLQHYYTLDIGYILDYRLCIAYNLTKN